MDAFAVSIVAGLTIRRLQLGHVLRLAFHFGFFQFLMPIVGWLAGRSVSQYIEAFDHWVAFGLLTYIGAKMIYESFDSSLREDGKDPSRGWLLVTLSVATSIDALAVGLTLALLDVSILLPSLIIGLVAGGMTTVGVLSGNRLGTRLSSWAERVGGLVLLAIGIRILVSHLT